MTSRRKLAAILFADIVGYTRQVNADEAKGLEHRREFEALARSAAVSHSGRVVKMIGDAAMLEFASAVEAVGCALDLQQQMADLDQRLGAGGQLRIRVGVHVGDVAEEDGDLYGNAVNIAQRVHDQAQPGGICITRDVYVQIRPIMKVRCEPAKRRPGKGMPEPIEVFSVIADLTGPLGDRRNGPARTHAWRSRPG
ncbi:MAG: adenylate/guanylate cyclase domain-containing protein, partial [Armatimonadetes bacterium]|nr:adenylate/guanylate cyclase domain-containing protein [Armatimonadota bacterium]